MVNGLVKGNWDHGFGSFFYGRNRAGHLCPKDNWHTPNLCKRTSMRWCKTTCGCSLTATEAEN
jgi:hypothetical protein